MAQLWRTRLQNYVQPASVVTRVLELDPCPQKLWSNLIVAGASSAALFKYSAHVPQCLFKCRCTRP